MSVILQTQSDWSSQALYIDPDATSRKLINPGDIEVQPLWLVVLLAKDACYRLPIGPDYQVALMIAADACMTLELADDADFDLAVLADGQFTIEDDGTPDFVIEIPEDAAFSLNVEACEV